MNGISTDHINEAISSKNDDNDNNNVLLWFGVSIVETGLLQWDWSFASIELHWWLATADIRHSYLPS